MNTQLLYKPQDITLPKVKPDSHVSLRKKNLEDYKKNDEKFANHFTKLTSFVKENKTKMNNLEWKEQWIDEWSLLQKKCMEIENSIVPHSNTFDYYKEAQELQQQRYEKLVDLMAPIRLDKTMTAELKKKTVEELKKLNEAEDFLDKELEVFITEHETPEESAVDFSFLIPRFEFEDNLLRKEFEEFLDEKRNFHLQNVERVQMEYKSLKQQPVLHTEAHRVFVKVCKYLQARQQKSINKKEVCKLVLLQCKSLEIQIEKEMVEKHFDWYIKAQALKWSNRDARETYKLFIITSTERMTYALKLSSELNLAKQRSEENKLATQKKKIELHEQLNLMHQQKQDTEIYEMKQLELLKLEVQTEETKKQEDFEKRRQQINKKLQQYYDKQLEQKNEMLQKQEEYAAYLKKQRTIKLQQNQKRVEFRAEKYEQKKEELKKKEHTVQQLEEEKLLRMENLKHNIDQKLQHIQPDFSRLIKPIEAHLASATDAPEKSNLFFTHGYTDKELFKDVRFRLQTAIYEAGLQNSQYAAEVFKRFANH